MRPGSRRAASSVSSGPSTFNTRSFINSAALVASSTWSALNDAALSLLAWSKPNTIHAGTGLASALNIANLPRSQVNTCRSQVNLPIRSVQILRSYDAPSVPHKDNRFDQELPSIRGSKVWRKGSRPVAWLDDMVEIDSLFRRFRRKLIPSLACSGAFDETALRLIPSFPLGNGLWWSTSCFRWSSPPSMTKSKYCEATMHPVYLTKINA